MKKLSMTICCTALLFSTVTLGQDFENVMRSTLSDLEECESIEDYQTLANQFKRIADVDKGEWLPYYYHAYCNNIMSFMAEGDATAMDDYLDVAQTSMVRLKELVPEESEIWALQAFIYTARLVVDPMTRGQEYSMLSSQANNRARTLNPDNPRVKYIELANNMGMAQFFGNDVSAYCKQAKELLIEWDQYVEPSPIHPSWGKNLVEDIVSSCQE